MAAESIENKVWDYIIVGTGMGGGPVGLKLAQAGFSVLFLEKGLSPNSSTALKGQFAEIFFGNASDSPSEILRKSGRLSQPLFDRTNSKERKIIPFMGSGVGGSSALYGAVLERFKPSDFKSWPVSYHDFQKYYELAEDLFRVRKPAYYRNPGNKDLHDDLVARGLHPYHLPLANDEKRGCGGCQSYLCNKNCKHESGQICIESAVQTYGATLITSCHVQKIEVLKDKLVAVTAVYQNQKFTPKARNMILAAGALMTPVILQRSGIGNESGLLGRNLMRHYVDLYALRIATDDSKVPSKEMGFDDYYVEGGQTLGTVQSFGRLPPVAAILSQMQQDIGSTFGSIASFLFKLVKPAMKIVLSKVTSNRLVMASILEDSPEYENRVWEENGEISISYKISADNQKKIENMRVKLKTLFKGYKTLFIKASEKNEMLAHVCGTCKMGTDPKASVVDTENKLHGFENVYVVDSSFFPTSGGTNPALTIAANSLRVAELLIAKEIRNGRSLSKESHLRLV